MKFSSGLNVAIRFFLFILFSSSAVYATGTMEAYFSFQPRYFTKGNALMRAVAIQAAVCQNPNLQLTKQLPLDPRSNVYFTPGDFTGDGKQDLAVYTAASISSLSKLDLLVGDGTGNLSTASSKVVLPQNNVPLYQMASGDFNGDGKLDVITLSPDQGPNLLRIFINNGSSGFADPIVIAARSFSFSLGDFNNDGKTDIAVSLCCPDTVIIYLSNVSNTFAPTSYSWGASRASAVGDFNGDGNLDVITSDNYYPSHQIRLGNGKGQFTNGDYLYYGVDVMFFATTDFNKDGKADVLGNTGNNRSRLPEANSGKVILLSGDGTGHFAESYPFAGYGSLAADFTGDGFPDIAEPSINIYTNNGSGGLCPAFLLTNNFIQNSIGAADFDGDGKADLVLAAEDKLEIWTSDGSTTTNTPPTIVAAAPISARLGSTSQFSNLVAVATVNDAQTPLGNLTVTATSIPAGLTVERITNSNGQITAAFGVACGTALGQKSVEFTVTDSNGATAKASLTVNVIARETLAGPSRTVTIPVGMGLEEYVLGKLDFVVSPSFSGNVKFYFGGSNTSLRILNAGPIGTHTITLSEADSCGVVRSTVITVIVTGETPACKFPVFQKQSNTNYTNISSVNNADFNLDGKQDIAVQSNGILRILHGNGRGGFSEAQAISTGSSERYVLVDLDGDGDSDFLSFPYVTGDKVVWINNGESEYTRKIIPNLGVFSSFADFNNDRKVDLYLFGNGQFQVRIGDGAGNFSDPFITPTRGGPQRIGDFNGDGKMDFVVIDNREETHYYYYSDGTGKFLAPSANSVGNTFPIAVADIDKDGQDNLIYYVDSRDFSTFLFNTGYWYLVTDKFNKFLFDRETGVFGTGDFNGDGNLDMMFADGRIALQDSTGSLCAAPGVYPLGGTADFDGDGATDIIQSSANQIDIYFSGNGTAENTPPIFTQLQRTNTSQGAAPVALTFGKVADAQTPAGSLQLSASNLPAGVTLTNLRSVNGTISAELAVTCGATIGTSQIPIKVTDDGGLSTTKNWALTVNANQAPVLGTYPNTTLNSSIVQITPSQTPADDGTITSLTISETNYSDRVSVAANGVVTIVNNNVAGTYQATVNAQDNCGLVKASTVNFTIPAATPSGCNIPSFQRGTTVAIASAVSLIPGDFNKDGFQDVIVVRTLNPDGSFALSTTYFGDGRGGFNLVAGRSDFNSVFSPGDLVKVGDFNGDGYLDLGTLRFSTMIGTRPQYRSFQILLNDKSGRITGDRSYDGIFYSYEVGDLNNDGFSDAVVNTGYNNSVLLNNKNNTFTKLQNEFGFPTKMILVRHLLSTFLVNESEGTNYVFGSDGAGGFVPTNFRIPGRLQAVADITQSNTIPAIITSLNGQLTIDFGTKSFPEYTSPVLTSADFNGDHVVDLLLADGRVPIYSLSSNTFCGTADYRAQGLTNPAVAADFDGDGRADILTINASGFTFWKSGSGGGGAANTPPTITVNPHSLAQGVNTGVAFGIVKDNETPIDNLQLSAAASPAGVTLSNLRSANGVINANLAVTCGAAAGTYQIPITVTDGGGLTATANWSLNIVTNQAPVLGIYANVTVNAASVQVRANASQF